MEVLEYEFKNSHSRLLALNYSWHVKSSCLVLAGGYKVIFEFFLVMMEQKESNLSMNNHIDMIFE